MSRARTLLLLSVFTGTLVCAGYLIAGGLGLLIALGLAAFANLASWWFSAAFVLRLYDARQLTYAESPALFRILQGLARRAAIPIPRVYLIPERAPNAFATGRNPEHAAVAVTEGLLRLLNEPEIEAVLAHEVAHILHRDTQLMSIVATFAGSIASLASFVFWGKLPMARQQNPESLPGRIARIIAALIAPFAGALLHFTRSRTREFAADQTAAVLTGNPLGLASALEKVDAYSRHLQFCAGSRETALLFIQNPFPKEPFAGLVQTHPRTQDRVGRLWQMARQMRIAA